MSEARAQRGGTAPFVVPAVVGMLGARVAAVLSATVDGSAWWPSLAIGAGLALLVAGITLGAARALDTLPTLVARGVALAATPLALVALLPSSALRFASGGGLAAMLAQPIGTASGWRTAPPGTAPLWICAGLGLAVLVLGTAWTIVRAWRADAAPTARALVLLGWALLLPLALWRVTVSPAIGDEPHYLVIAESLLHDGDVDVSDDYDAATLERLSPYLRGPAAEHVRTSGGEAVSIHAAGLSVLVLPAWAAAGRSGVAALLSLLAAMLAAWLAVAARRLALGEDVARCAWTIGAFLSPIFVFAPLLYPEPVAACAAFGAYCVALRDGGARTDDVAAGAALGALGLLHVKFLLLGGTVLATGVVWCGWRARTRMALVATAAAIAALASVVVHLRVHGAINPYGGSGPATFSISTLFGLNPLAGAIDLLIAPQGLLPPYPLLAFAPLGALVLARRAPRDAWRTVTPIVPFYLLYCPYAFWFGGTVPPARMLLPIVPWVVLLAAVGIERARAVRIGRTLLAAVGAIAVAFSLLGTAAPSLWLFPWLGGVLASVVPTVLVPIVVTPVLMPGLGAFGLVAGALLLAALVAASWRASAALAHGGGHT